MNNEKLIDIAPQAIRLAIKMVKFSSGGFTTEEKKELGADLLALALVLLEQAKDGK
jgi:hypothetical protein